jgi:methyltransferase (TIGR00027 family)
MKASKSSKTAAQMALSRAIENRRPAVERICEDPLAERFLDGAYRLLLVARPLRAGVERFIERRFPGHHNYVLVRTRYFDEFLGAQLASGAEQLVILGAGYDSRAYRFADRLRKMTVFEVDHPATSSEKRARVARALGGAPANVRFVAVDFNRDALSAKLAESGYRGDRRAIFLWEGTTPYVSAAGVDDTLRFISSNRAHGTVVIFDYVLESVVAGTCAMRGARNEHDKMSATSEPFVFGIDAERIEAFLAERGFMDMADVGADELSQSFMRGERVSRYIKPWWRIVRATVR